jgi:choice-of-anchor B domain-containing protein
MKSASLTLLAAGVLFAAADGRAQLQSSNATLLSRFDPPGFSYNDCWGYRSPSGGEYALLGATTGTFVVDCTDPSNPVQRAFFNGPSSTWRDIRTYQHYAYVVTEGGGGMQIIDLQDPDNPILLGTWGQSLWSHAHNISLDTKTGMVFPCGTNIGTAIIDLTSDPTNPTFLGTYSTFYVHDLQVQDGWAHLAEINNSRYRILDASSLPTATSVGSSFVTSCHNVWPTRDNDFAVTSSETSNGGFTIFDVRIKQLPLKIATWNTGMFGASVHNVFVLDRVVHSAYYSEGYRAVDLSDPTKPRQVAFVDTSSATSGFNGAWGCYPFQPSGVVYVSDVQNGLSIIDSKATSDYYGSDTPGASGAPVIHTFGTAFALNGTFAFEVENARPNSTATLILGFGDSSLSVSGVNIAVDLSLPFVQLTVPTDASGKAVVPFPIPANPPEVTLYAQFLVTDPTGPIGLTTTQGVRFDMFKRQTDM